jgi:hypothetical protein
VNEPAPLPRREPRPAVVHWLVDSAIAFLVIILPALMWEIDLRAIIVSSLIVGLVGAHFTRRAEGRALAARPEPEAHGD